VRPQASNMNSQFVPQTYDRHVAKTWALDKVLSISFVSLSAAQM